MSTARPTQQIQPPPLGSISQVAYVVQDLDATLAHWVDVLRVGPFFIFDHAEIEHQRYRGGPSDIDVTLAVANSGDIQIELIYCEDDAPSVYREFLDAGRSGVHHVGLMPEDYAATCAAYLALGHAAAFECRIAGTDLVYFDTVAALGHFTELWDRSDSFIAFQQHVKSAAYHWDGSNPVRRGAI
ncbi:MAG: VOC family protein [Pseudomonadota bacterium]